MMKRLPRIAALLVIGWPLGGTGSWCQKANQRPLAGCTAGSRRVVEQQWDPVLKRGWELVADCAHPDWPARSVEIVPSRKFSMFETRGHSAQIAVAPVEPMMVQQGDAVTLRQESGNVRIEMAGAVEQTGRKGDHVVVRVMRQRDDSGPVVERIRGIVSGPGLVEMER